MSSESYAVVFPGQGAQASEMGAPWRDHPAWAVVERAEKVLERPLSPLLLGDPKIDLSRTENSQMSVLLVSLMGWEALHDAGAPSPAAFAGHSLGQITALIAAGALPFEDGIRLADRRAQLTQRDADERPGRMVALLGATPEQAEAACDGVAGAWVANDNTAGQIVLAGTPEGMAAASERARAAGVRRVMDLAVGGAFHTPLFEQAAADLSLTLGTLDWRDSAVPVVSNGDGSPVRDGAGWPGRLESHLTQPVRWRECMSTLSGLAATWVEAGPGTTLSAFAKRANPDITVISLSTPDDLEAVSQVLITGDSR